MELLNISNGCGHFIRKLAEFFQLKFSKVRSGIKSLFRIRIWILLTKNVRPDLDSNPQHRLQGKKT